MVRGGRAMRVVTAGLILVTLAACSDDKPRAQPPGATVPTEPPVTATTTTTDPYAVPAVIDAAYVNRVLAGLDQVFGDAFRLMVSAKGLPTESLERFRAVYGDRNLLNNQLTIVQRNVQADLDRLPAAPGNKQTTVTELLATSSQCIFARVNRNYAAFVGRGSQVRQEWIGLKPLNIENDPNRFNPTRWAYVYEGSDQNFQAPKESPCAAAS